MRTTIVAAVAAVLIALGGAPAAAFAACPEPVPHPGDDAPKPAIAQWMAAGAGRAAIPAELPVMGALVESGLRNLRTGGADAVGYFAMRTGLWNSGPYAGFPDHPHLQLQWFLDLATRVRQAQIAAGVPDPAVDESRWGGWIADVLRPAEQYRGRYQGRLAEARALIGDFCENRPPPAAADPPQDAAPVAASPAAAAPQAPAVPVASVPAPAQVDAVAPMLLLERGRAQRVISRGAIVLVVRCPQETCTVSATAAVTLPGRRTLRLTSPRRRVAAEQAAGLRLALAREARTRVRRALRSGRRLHALVRVLASDEAGNQTLVTRTIRLTG